MTEKSAESSAVVTVEDVGQQTTGEGRAKWLKEGTPKPDLSEFRPSSAEESAPAKPAGEETGKKAESGTAKKGDQERNWRALESDRDGHRDRADKAERENAELRRRLESQPPPRAEEKKAEPPKAPERPKRPRIADFDMTDKYEAAMDKYEEDTEKFRVDKAAWDRLQEQIKNAPAEQQRQLKMWQDKMREKYGDEVDKIDVKATMEKLVATLKDAPAFAAFLNDSEHFEDLLYVLGTDPKLDDLLSLAKSNPTQAVRKLIALEHFTTLEVESGGTKKEAKPAEGARKEPPPPQKQTTAAAKPPEEVGGKATAPGDVVEGAVGRKDFSSFRTEANKRDLARKGRR